MTGYLAKHNCLLSSEKAAMLCKDGRNMWVLKLQRMQRVKAWQRSSITVLIYIILCHEKRHELNRNIDDFSECRVDNMPVRVVNAARSPSLYPSV